MTTNQKIVASLLRAAAGEVEIPQAPGWCLSFVRAVVEDALYGGVRKFYDLHLKAGTTRRGGTEAERLREAWVSPWAADIERSMKVLGLGVPALLRRPGDLVFNHNAAAPVGHVGILLSRDLVVENINRSYRRQSVHLPRGSLSVTPFKSLPWTLVARLRE